MGKIVSTIAVLVLALVSFSLSYEEIKRAYEKSYLYERLGDYKNAIRVLMPVYEAYPEGYTVNLRLGWLYYLWGKYKNSEFHYRKAVKAVPSSAEAKLGLSLPLSAQQKWNEVESLMYRVLAVDYYNYYGNLRLCQALREQKKYDLMMAVAKKMLALYPTSVPFLVYLAEGYYLTGKKEEAENLFRDVLILDPENVTAKKYLRLLEEEGEKETEEGSKGEPSDQS
ncbi:MAG: hypothetical protein GXO08_00530 [Aquificae bacterium]|nr:hypothetical protein [Aquificota bacterium]